MATDPPRRVHEWIGKTIVPDLGGFAAVVEDMIDYDGVRYIWQRDFFGEDLILCYLGLITRATLEDWDNAEDIRKNMGE